MGRPERPVDASAGPVAAFAVGLRELRRSAGGPSYRTLAERARFSPSVLSAAASGYTLPTLPVTLAFVEACGGDRATWERRWRAAARAAGVPADGTGDRRGPPTPGPSGLPTPRCDQFPAGLGSLVGRRRELALLDELTRAGSVPILLTGPVGVGKSALAIGWGRLAGRRFPGGLLYADLAEPVAAGDPPYHVLADLLPQLGAHRERPPAGPAQRAARYRALLSGRRVLVLLDNAVDESQVRPLLADVPGSQVVITSRNRLAGLDGIIRVPLPLLSAEGALDLIGTVVGAGQLATHRRYALELVELCEHLPLALRSAAVRVAVRPGRTLAHAVERLRDETARLDQLRTGDTGVRERLRQAVATVDDRARSAFGDLARLGRTAGGHLDVAAAARAWHLPAPAAEELMERLVDAGLVLPGPGVAGYRLPALFRLYAAELAAAEDAAPVERGRPGGDREPRPLRRRELGLAGRTGWPDAIAS